MEVTSHFGIELDLSEPPAGFCLLAEVPSHFADVVDDQRCLHEGTELAAAELVQEVAEPLPLLALVLHLLLEVESDLELADELAALEGEVDQEVVVRSAQPVFYSHDGHSLVFAEVVNYLPHFVNIAVALCSE